MFRRILSSVVPKEGEIDELAFRRSLLSELPVYMVPTRFVYVGRDPMLHVPTESLFLGLLEVEHLGFHLSVATTYDVSHLSIQISYKIFDQLIFISNFIKPFS